MVAGETRRRLGAADRSALIALTGVLVALALWTIWAWASSFLTQVPFEQSFLSPSDAESLPRFIGVVVVLGLTLLGQAGYSRWFRTLERLRIERGRIEQLYANSPDATFSLTPQLTVDYANPVGAELAIAPGGGLVGAACHEAIWGRSTPCDGCIAAQVVADGARRERVVHETSENGERWYNHLAYPVLGEEGVVESVVEVYRDITSLRLAEQALRIANTELENRVERISFFDTLTGLPNRALYQDRLESALAQARRREELVASVFIDIDDFKTINDSLGHDVGDEVLKAVAERFSSILREEDTIARQGGDEFSVLGRVADRGGAFVLANRLLGQLREPLFLGGHELHLTASVGAAVSPVDGVDATELTRNADTAMCDARRAGRGNVRLYTPEMSATALDRLELESQLRVALEEEQFVLHYQPQIDATSGMFVGVEALVRWQHPWRGLIGPGAFIELAEQAGLMGELGHWVLRTACAQGAAWCADGLDFGRMCVNLSAKEFVQQDIVGNVKAALEDSGLAPHMLELEITESVAMHNVDHALSVLAELRELGVRVAIDDFGTGHSSMTYVKRFPIHTLKIAQDFMRDVHTNAQSAAIANMVIELCRELRLDIVAEGVERAEQLEFLRVRGCHVIQGYLYSRPVATDELRAILASGAPLQPTGV